IRDDGSILVAGSVGKSGERDGALFLFGENGLPDRAFGDKGVLITEDAKDTVFYDALVTEAMVAATGVTVGEDGMRESILVTYARKEGNNATQLFQQQMTGAAENDEDSEPIAQIVTTEVDNEEDYTFSLAAADAGSVVVAGASGAQEVAQAAVRKYTIFQAGVSDTYWNTDTGNASLFTGQPLEVTRTTSLIPVEISSELGTVTERGIVFSVDPLPTLKGSTTSTVVDETAPSITSSTKSSFSTAEQVLLVASTNEDAICRYNKNFDEDYEEMEGVLSSSFGSGHHVSLGQLAEGSYTYYVRCKDTKGNINTSGTSVNFTVAAKESDSEEDTTPPTITESTEDEFLPTEEVILVVSTDEDATCRYNANYDEDYSEMSHILSSSFGTGHHVVLGTLAEGDYTFYVRCKDEEGNTKTPGTSVNFTVAADTKTEGNTPARSALSPSGTVSSSSVTLSLTTNVAATCKYTDSSAGMDYSNMKKFFDTTGGTKHSEPVTGLAEGEHTYYVRCKNDSTGVANTTDETIIFTVDTTVIDITQSYFDPDKKTLSVTTDVDAHCKYKKGIDVDYALMTDFTDTDSTLHEETFDTLTKGDIYYVRCQDTEGNTTSVGTAISYTVDPTPPSPQTTSLIHNNFRTGITFALESVSELFVSTAMAQEDTDSTTTTTATTSTSSSTEVDTEDNNFLEQGSVEEGSGTGKFTVKLEDLKPGTVFYARAYAVVNGITYYGNQISFQTADSCFVATAAYGSLFHPAVQLLRDFRDRFMLDNAVSRSLVRLYYRYSPPIADMIHNSTVLRPMTRILLMPIIGSAWLTMRFGWIWLLLPAAALIVLSWFGGMRMKRKACNL
ncbi:MAG: hypothetical protein D3905_08055, partial [Candidatus Electrothrix sp. AS4_5]|nr:hypothetical protein [Candidatus Electrothrix gigas]